MSKRNPIFKVIVGGKGVVLERLKRGRPGYRKAKRKAILRQRDAIELFRKLKKGGKSFSGNYTFHLLDTARTFAMLRLQAQLREVQGNLDQVLAYDGSAKRSDEE